MVQRRRGFVLGLHHGLRGHPARLAVADGLVALSDAAVVMP
jgi:hypothetical protein